MRNGSNETANDPSTTTSIAFLSLFWFTFPILDFECSVYSFLCRKLPFHQLSFLSFQNCNIFALITTIFNFNNVTISSITAILKFLSLFYIQGVQLNYKRSFSTKSQFSFLYIGRQRFQMEHQFISPFSLNFVLFDVFHFYWWDRNQSFAAQNAIRMLQCITASELKW